MKKLLSNKIILVIILLYIAFAAWWVALKLLVDSSDSSNSANKLYTVSYGVIALVGGLSGIIAAKKWGGWKSLLGRAILVISLGLLMQEFGQIMYSYYIYLRHTDVPYPSLGDIGYYGSVLLYCWGVLLLCGALGIKLFKASVRNKLIATVIPIVLLGGSYLVFLKGYNFSDSGSLLQTFLDFGYPLTQSVYVSIAFLAYLLTRKLLGGVMRSRILLLLVAFAVQYFADASFLYQQQQGTWYAGNWNDMVYATAYMLMAIAITYIGQITFGSSKPEAPTEVPEISALPQEEVHDDQRS